MRRPFVFGALLLGACQSSSPASPPSTVADVPVVRPEPPKAPTWTVEAPVGQPTALIGARMKAMRHRIAACLDDAVNRDPLLSGESVATFSWSTGDILSVQPFEGVLSGHEGGRCFIDTFVESATNLSIAGAGGADGEFEFTLRINFAGPYPAGPPSLPPHFEGEERWSVFSEADDGTLTLSAAAPTGVSREDLLRCRVPKRTSPRSDGGWLVGRIDRTGKLIFPPTDGSASRYADVEHDVWLPPSDDTLCLRRVLSRATFAPGPVRYFKLETYPDDLLWAVLREEFEEEMGGLDALAVAEAAKESEPAKAGDDAVEFGRVGLLRGEGNHEASYAAQAKRMAAVAEEMQSTRVSPDGSIGLSGGALGNAAQGGLGSTGGGGQGFGQFDGKPLAELKLSRHFAEAAPLGQGSRLSGLWFVIGTGNQEAPIVAIARGPESQAQTQAQTDCHVRDRGVELRFFARDPANAASACKDFAAKHVQPID